MKGIITDCDRCGGDGIEEITTRNPDGTPGPSTSQTCEGCEGEGHHVLGHLSSDLEDFLNDLKNKVDDIFEKVNE